MIDSRHSLRSAVCRRTSTTDGSSENFFHDDQPRDGLERLLDAGTYVILTTHFLEEADILSDRIAIMTHGQLQASGTPSFLKRHLGISLWVFRLIVLII